MNCDDFAWDCDTDWDCDDDDEVDDDNDATLGAMMNWMIFLMIVDDDTWFDGVMMMK